MKTNIHIALPAAICLLAMPATAQVNYAASGGTARVGPSPYASGDIVIASTYNGFPVTRILSQAFLDCTNLTSVTIPNSVTNIGGNAFYRCTGLTNIAVALDNPSYSSPDGVLFNKAQTTLIQFPCGRGLGYAIPNGVTVIAPAAFYRCTGLTNVMIPNTVLSIGLDAFSGCTGLTDATIPDSVTTIQSAAFYACTSLTSVTIPNSVTGVGSRAFAGCTSLTNITVAVANPAYSSLDGIMFNKAQTVLLQFPGGRGGSYTIPDGVTSFGLAFSACPNLASVTIPNSVTSIGFQAFSGCASLESVTIPSSVTTIDGDAFSGCHALKNVTIPNSVTSVGAYAFFDCASLTNMTIGNSVTNIGDNAFYYCTSLLNITVHAANSVYTSVTGVLFNKAQTTLIQFPGGRRGTYVIPSSIAGIRNYAFFACSLANVTIPASVTNIGDYPFAVCASLTNITVNAANSVYSSVNGVLFDKTQTTLIQFPGGRAGSYAIPSSVTNIAWLAFYGGASLTSVTIPNSVTYIGHSAFTGCSSLANLVFLGNAPLLSGTVVFYGIAAGATVYYYYGTIGWEQTYGGLPAVMLGAPAPRIGAATAGVKPGGYGFILSGVTNQTIVVEASTNLTHWQPIWTSTLSALSTNFIDPDSVNHPHRFYRAQSY